MLAFSVACRLKGTLSPFAYGLNSTQRIIHSATFATVAAKLKSKSPIKKPSTTTTKAVLSSSKQGTPKEINSQSIAKRKGQGNANIPTVAFKRKRRKRATTATMARAAKAYSRHQRRLAGDKSVGPSTPEEEVLVELYEQTEGHTIQVTREEFDAPPEKLSFEQLYRRILRSFEDHRLPQRELLFEMLNKTKSPEDWDNFVIIAKIYQAKLIVLRPYHASHIVHLAINKGLLNQLYEEMHKNIFYLYPSKAGYHKLIVELAKADQLDKVWKTLQLMAEREIQPAQRTFCALIELYKEKNLDVAFKFFKASSGLGVRTTSLDANILGTKLALLDRWNDVLEIEKIAKKDNPNKSFRKLIALIFINAYMKAGNTEGALQLIKAQMAELREDVKQLTDADKQAFPFVVPLIETIQTNT